ncbi:hypothetical protein [Mesorhizobium sp. M1B.F.Ca.ET.045.04.1.1]|uniref:hypothetical protein n=1 Tax=Mesorhizobium sp. M1B.F.Ca.ET.045.04.1.1 TaxID=2493673 RepID=UPI000F764FC6|nr:hypothetical protein [Mesorhizobium sp. M1B.F.Ca.ET.045.04.1.1]AZO28363.1 hypothetical protein EJ071_13720 [Mesorhizobium sp. M1B.F.Ca.ET.045.04.1.1]
MRRPAVLAAWAAAAVAVSGCGTPKDKTAPCKRPAMLSSYAAADECGPMKQVNDMRAKAAIRALQAGQDSDG